LETFISADDTVTIANTAQGMGKAIPLTDFPSNYMSSFVADGTGIALPRNGSGIFYAIPTANTAFTLSADFPIGALVMVINAAPATHNLTFNSATVAPTKTTFFVKTAADTWVNILAT
jgi:hypothetical protein